MISDTLFHTESQIDDVEIPGIFDILECGEDDTTVKFLLGFNDESTRCFVPDGGDHDDQINKFNRGLKDDDSSTDSEDLQNMVPFDKCITYSVVVPPTTGQEKTKSKRRIRPKSNGPQRRNQMRDHDHPCTHCFKRFSTPFNLRRHMNLYCSPELKLAALTNKLVQKKPIKKPEIKKKVPPKVEEKVLTYREALYRKIRRQRKKMWRQRIKNQKQMKEYNQRILPKLLSLEPVPVHELENLEAIQPQSQVSNMTIRKSVMENNMILLENFLYPHCHVTVMEEEQGVSNDQGFGVQEEHDLNQIELYQPHWSQDNPAEKGFEMFHEVVPENHVQVEGNFDDGSVTLDYDSLDVLREDNFFYIDGKPFVIVRPVVEQEAQFKHSNLGLNLTSHSGVTDKTAQQEFAPTNGFKENGDLVEIILTREDDKIETSGSLEANNLTENLQITPGVQVNLSCSLEDLVEKENTSKVTTLQRENEGPEFGGVSNEILIHTENMAEADSLLHFGITNIEVKDYQQKSLPQQILVIEDPGDPQFELLTVPYNQISSTGQKFQRKFSQEMIHVTNQQHPTLVHLPQNWQMTPQDCCSRVLLLQHQQECQLHPECDHSGAPKTVKELSSSQTKECASSNATSMLLFKDPNRNCLPDITQVPRGWMRRVTTEFGNRKVHYFSTVGKKFSDAKEISNHFARLGQTVKPGVFNFD